MTEDKVSQPNYGRLTPIKAVCQRLGVSRSTVYRTADSDPSFPRPVRIGAKRIFFLEEEVEAYLRSRVESRPLSKRAA